MEKNECDTNQNIIENENSEEPTPAATIISLSIEDVNVSVPQLNEAEVDEGKVSVVTQYGGIRVNV